MFYKMFSVIILYEKYFIRADINRYETILIKVVFRNDYIRLLIVRLKKFSPGHFLHLIT